jgi:hypothetical protein
MHTLSRQQEMGALPGQFIGGHPPMRDLSHIYHTMLVVGGEGEKCGQVAEGYRFRNAITPGIYHQRYYTFP